MLKNGGLELSHFDLGLVVSLVVNAAAAFLSNDDFGQLTATAVIECVGTETQKSSL